MKNEEITLSEDLNTQHSWRSWLKSNWVFLIIIGGLSTISMAMVIQNRWPSQVTIQTENITPLPKPTPKVHKPRKVKKSNPFSQAERDYLKGDLSLAISHLLKITSTHPNANIREKAADLSKKYRRIQIEKEKIKRIYLDGYILFHSYPDRACQKWATVLQSSLHSDAYYQKGLTRWKNYCRGSNTTP